MFVAVVLDMGSEDSLKAASGLLYRYGFRRMQSGVFESAAVDEKSLIRLKLDMDRRADFYDSIRFYQYPVDGTLVVTCLGEKRWRRITVREPEGRT